MYRKIILDAIKDGADSKDRSRMIVLINYKTTFRDFADFNKYDPEFWENIAKEVFNNSSKPEFAMSPISIAAGQYLLGGPKQDMDKAKEMVAMGMSIDSDHKFIQLYAKAIVGMSIGAIKNMDGLSTRLEMIESCKEQNAQQAQQLEECMLSGNAEADDCENCAVGPASDAEDEE